jgi:hypothetical protein
MNDTSPKVEQLVKQWYEDAGPDKRVQIASEMYDTARTIILSSLPEGLSRYERRLAYIERMYGDELPTKAKIAFANHIEREKD